MHQPARLMRKGPRGRTATRRVAVFTYDGGQSLDVTGPLEAFAVANRIVEARQPVAAPAYSIEILAAKAGPVRMRCGVGLLADRSYAAVARGIDTLIVAGGDARIASADPRLRTWLRGIAPRVRRLASVCTGAFILAEAGLLDGRRATTHWAATAALARRYPRITVEPDAIFVRDGRVYTSAGVTAGIDLALALVEEDHGHAVALAVARHLVVFLKRPGGQSQFSSHLAAQAAAVGVLKGVPEWILANLRADLSVERLAERAAMSPRHFARVFCRETGVTPAKFVERARVESARQHLEDARLGLEDVAQRCGFGSAEHMRRTFRRHLRVVPADYRKRFHQPPPRLRASA